MRLNETYLLESKCFSKYISFLFVSDVSAIHSILKFCFLLSYCPAVVKKDPLIYLVYEAISLPM